MREVKREDDERQGVLEYEWLLDFQQEEDEGEQKSPTR